MAIHFDVIRDGAHCSARVDRATTFAIAAKVTYRNKKTGVENVGLSNDGGLFGSTEAKKQLYRARDFGDVYHFWAEFIEPTAICEGQSFISLNTYDRARFTFGFGQFAAHVPNGDFISWFRDMLKRPEALDYFPDLEVVGGHVCKMEEGRPAPLESDESTAPLQTYLNPTLDGIEDAEVIAAAKLIHWTINHEKARLLQVQHMVDTAQKIIQEADRRLNLDGLSADLCCIILDVRHQGRAGYADLQAALLETGQFEALLKVGGRGQPDRVKNLKKAIAPRRASLKQKIWSRSTSDFV